MKKTIIISFIILLSNTMLSLGQSVDTITKRSRNFIWYVQSKTRYINGLSLGIKNMPEFYKQTINGISLELLGYGWITPFLGLDDGRHVEKTKDNFKINGLIVGLTLLSGNVNGISTSILIGTNNYLNGISISTFNFTLYKGNGLMAGLVNYANELNGTQIGLYNYTNLNRGVQLGLVNQCGTKSKGIQLGIINRTENHRGLQLGLWNKNEKRTLPIINWQFRDKRKRIRQKKLIIPHTSRHYF